MGSPATNSWLDLLPQYSLLRNEERRKKLVANGIRVFDFGLGDPREETPLFIKQALLDGVSSVSQYPSTIGSVSFRKICAAWVQRRFSVDLDWQSQIISSNGSKEAVFHIPHVILNSASARRIIVFPDPGYPVYKNSVILSGGIPLQVNLSAEKNYVFDPSQIPKELLSQVAAVWINYPHNPTGAVIDISKMREIYAWALEKNIILLSDECYVDMFFPNTPRPAGFLEVAAAEGFRNLLCFFSLSKRSGMTGYRSGFVAGSKDLIAQFTKYRPNAGLGTPDFVQAAAIAAWNDDNHVVDRNAIFKNKRLLVEEFFDKNNIQYLPSNATFYVWAKIPDSFASGEEYAEALAKATGIIVTPGDALGESCADRFRLALVPTADEIKTCLQLWQNAILEGIL